MSSEVRTGNGLRFTLSYDRIVEVTVEGPADCRTEPCCGGRHVHVQQHKSRNELHCGPKALSSKAHFRWNTSHSSDGASAQVLAERSCCSKTRLGSFELTSDLSLRKAKYKQEKKKTASDAAKCFVDKIPYLKFHCNFFFRFVVFLCNAKR